MTTPIRTALLGYGMGGECFHAPFIATNPGLELTVVVTRNAERRARVAQRYPTALLADDLDAALAIGVDLVVVTTPNDSHVSLTTQALQAGTHVVLDKPMAATSQDAFALIALANAQGRVLSVYQDRRWDDDFLTISSLVEDGAIGNVLRFGSRYERWRPTPKVGWREQAAPELAGGVLFDLGAHLIDQAVQLLGPPESVYAEVAHQRAGVVVDDDVFLAMRHDAGVVSHLSASMVTAQSLARFRVIGSEGSLVSFGMDPQEEALKAGDLPNRPGWGTDSERVVLVGSDDDRRDVAMTPGNYGAFYDGMVASINEGIAPPVDPRDSARVIQIIEAAQRSVATASVVALTV